MSDSTPTGSEKFWDKTAQRYAKSTISDQASYQRKLKETQAHLTQDSRVLEFGCGTGSTAIVHAPEVQQIDAMDISEQMLAIARSKAEAAGLTNIHFMQGDVASLATMSGNYDAILALNVIHLLPNRAALFAEVARLLQPGGVFVSSTACIGDTAFRHLKFIVPIAKKLGLVPDVYAVKESELVQELIDAGFQIQQQWRHGSKALGLFIIATRA